MLVHRQRVAKPGDVAHIHQGRGRGGRVLEAQGQFFAKQVFVTNVRGQALALPSQRRLVPSARFEIAQRDVHHAYEPGKARRDELAKGHQVRFVIAVGRSTLRPQRHHRVAVALVQATQRDANQCQRTPRLSKVRLQSRPISRWQVARQQGDGGFRGHHQGLLTRAQLFVVPLQGVAHATGGLKLVGLRYVGLQQLHLSQAGGGGEHRPIRLQSPSHDAHTQQGLERPQAPTRQRQAHGQPSGHRTHAVHTDPWRKRNQSAVHMRIAPGPPRKTREPAPAHEFGQGPHRGEQYASQTRPLAQQASRQAHPDGRSGSVVKRQRRCQSQNGQHRQGRGQAPDMVH